MSRRAPAAILAVAALLAGCVSVLPAGPAVQLYRFGADVAAPPTRGRAPSPGAPGLVLSSVTLPRAAAGDGLLAITGDQAAYLGHARWVSPAAVLMQEAAERAFSTHGGARLLRRDAPAGAAGLLSLEVRDFEVRYATPGATPVVRVTVHAVVAGRDGAPVAERTFAADQPAAENRLSVIVPAYDAAVRRVLGEVAGWADGAARALPTPQPAVVTRTTTETGVRR